MAPKSRSLPLIILVSLLISSLSNNASAALGGGTRVGGWRTITNLKDPHVIEIAKFAVTEHNKQAKTTLKFASLVKGETQPVAGTNYKLVIAAKDATNNYQAVVWEKPWENFRQLTSFQEVKG